MKRVLITMSCSVLGLILLALPVQSQTAGSTNNQAGAAVAPAQQSSVPLNVAVQPGQPIQITIQSGGASANPGAMINEPAGAQVQTQQVGRVILQGLVKDAAQKGAIEEHIIMVPGITVDNQLRVAGPVVPEEPARSSTPSEENPSEQPNEATEAPPQPPNEPQN